MFFQGFRGGPTFSRGGGGGGGGGGKGIQILISIETHYNKNFQWGGGSTLDPYPLLDPCTHTPLGWQVDGNLMFCPQNQFAPEMLGTYV